MKSPGVEKLVFCFVFVVDFFKNQKPLKVEFVWFFNGLFFRFLIFSYKFCAQTIIFYYNFIFNLHEFTFPL